MYTPKDYLVFSAVAFVATLFFLTTSKTTNAGTGRNSNYSNSSGHGGYGDDLKGVTRLPGYAPGNCAHCHEMHASVDGTQPVPVNAGPSRYALFDDLAGNVFCNYCHNNSISNGADNIAQQISKAYSHDPNSAISTVLCTDCHDSHEATPVRHIDPPQNGVGNTVSGVLQGVAGVNITSGGWPPAGSPSANNEILNPPISLPALDPITLEYQLCFKCHGGQVALLTDLAGQFNPGNASVHPVTTTAWKNSFLLNPVNAANAMKPPWQTPDTQMYCSDCHASDTSTDPQGPHGSTNIYLLRDAGDGTTLDNLCETCHDVLTSSSWDSSTILTYGINKDHDFGAHKYPANTLGCLACHGGIDGPLESNIHGANYKWPDEGANPGNLSTSFLVGGNLTKNYSIGVERWCSSSCHQNDGGIGYRYR